MGRQRSNARHKWRPSRHKRPISRPVYFPDAVRFRVARPRRFLPITHELRRPAPRLIPIAALVPGLASIATEISASRLIAPYFGSSTFIWANLIGVTLLFLSL